ncbi:MAG: hypothetical protein AB1468_02125 [Candidatus Micrarchaeota archaeon]
MCRDVRDVVVRASRLVRESRVIGCDVVVVCVVGAVMKVTELSEKENKACELCRVRRARLRLSDDELGAIFASQKCAFARSANRALNMCEQCNQVLHDSSLNQTRIHFECEPIRVAC